MRLSVLMKKLARTEFARKAIEEKADLSAFCQIPTPKVIFGIFLLVFSYVICWPMVGALGMLAVAWGKPLLIFIGGPLAIGLSYLVFILGMALGGADYVKVFFRWAARVMIEKYPPPGASA